MGKFLLAANMVALAAFLGLAFLLPLHGESQARARYADLIESGAINVGVADKARNAATEISAASLMGARIASNIGIAVTLMNVTLHWAAQGKAKKK